MIPIVVGAAARRRNPMSPQGPFNAASTITIPTPDGTGHTVHPSVVDFDDSPWRGWRYWMADTPYHNLNVQVENPIIVVSDDGLTWVEPEGISNPIDPWPEHGYNSDTELAYDPENDRLVCYWRDYVQASQEVIFCAAVSTDGVTWSEQIDLLAWQFYVTGAIFSPAVVRAGAGDWRMWVIDENGPFHHYTASDPLGPWVKTADCSFGGSFNGGIADLWHGDVVQTQGGVWRYIVNAPRGTQSRLWGASSLDGITWSGWEDLQIVSRAGQWDAQIYRATLVPAGQTMRCWYSAYGYPGNQPRVGYTEIPLALWPAPPVT